MAELRGKPASKVAGLSGSYALCRYHHKALGTTWHNVIVESFEFFPEFIEQEPDVKDQTRSDVPWHEDIEVATGHETDSQG